MKIKKERRLFQNIIHHCQSTTDLKLILTDIDPISYIQYIKVLKLKVTSTL
jgi:hypothetical protein